MSTESTLEYPADTSTAEAAPEETLHAEAAEGEGNSKVLNPYDEEARKTVERTLENGTELRVTVAPLPNERIRVIQYERKPAGGRWVTSKQEENQEMHFETMNIAQTWEELFGFEPLYLDEDPEMPTRTRRARNTN